MNKVTKEAFIGLDVSKDKNAKAIAVDGNDTASERGSDNLEAPAIVSREIVQSQLNKAIKLHTSGKYSQAMDAYKDVLGLEANAAHAWINLGILNRTMERYEAAVIYLRRGLAINPENANGWSSLGNALRALNRLKEAKKAQERGLSISPEIAQIHYNYALVLRDMGLLDTALEAFTRAQASGYDKPELLWDRSITNLTRGNYGEGFAEYESRWHLKDNSARHADLPDWDGSDISDKTLLVYAEQGQGDSLQFVRYLPQLIGKTKSLIFDAQPSIVSLLQNNPLYNGITVHSRVDGQPGPEADIKVALLSLPLRLSIEDDLFSTPMPYLAPPAEGFRLRKPKGNAFRVGLTWAGKPTHKNDRNRSITLSQLSPLLDINGIEFVSFQLGGNQNQIADEGLDAIIRDLSPHLSDFSSTASLLQDIDLLISVDTSIIHLAGAMGVPTWAMIPFTPDWRWLSVRSDTHWYPNTTLFRQTSPGDWTGLFRRMREALKKKVNTKPDGP